MMQPLKRLIAALMALVLICTAVPFPAYAELIDTAPGYSFFGLIKPGEGQTIESLVDTYVFKNGETVVSTQSIKEGEETTVVAPASPEKTGYKFLGWKDSNGDPFTGAGEFIGGKTYTYTADFQEIYYVFFLDEDGRVIETREGTKGTVITADATFAVDPGEAISGWYTEAEKTNRVTSVTLKDQNITLYPKVEPGYWLEFETDGGTYFAPKFVAPGAATVRPATDPERPGYTFQGWVDADGKEFQFGQTITANTTVYAKWQGEPADYTVIYWQEHANDAEFSSVEVVKKSGYTGDVAVYDNKNYDGFTLITEGDKAPGEKTIAGDGSTIVNVYYSRNVYTIYFFDTNGSLTASYSCGLSEHKHSQWNCYELNCDRWFMHSHKFPDCYQLTCTKPEHTHNSSCIADSSSVSGYRYKIEAKHGAKIGNKWPTNKNGSTMWATNQDGSAPYQAGIDVMPIGGGSFYVPDTSSTKTSTAYYYVEVLEGETGDVTVGGRTYKFHHKDTAIGSGLTVTDEDFYPLTGFTKNTTDSTKNKSSYNGATFYYYRNVHTIKFMNNGTLDDTVPKQYEASIADADYTPNRPTTIPEDYTFKGWYDNEKCAGDAYVFEGKTMPDADITLYAKWEAPTFNATAHVTMAGTDSGQTFEIPYGSTIDKDSLPKYEVPDNYTDRGWAVKNGDKYEPFNFNTKIFQDITLYPYYTSNESFGVVYNANGGDSETVPTDSRKYADGTSADVKSAAGLTAPNKKVFRGWSLSSDGLSTIYQPGDKIQILAQNAQGETDHKVITLYAIWGDAPTGTTLTYYPNYPAGSTGHGSEDAVVVETINNAIVTLQGAGNFECDGYEFRGWSTTAGGSVNYTAGEKVLVDNKDTNDLYAVWQANKFDVTYSYTGTAPAGAPALPKTTQETVKSTVQVADKPTMAGYTFSGWTTDDATVADGKFTMPAKAVAFTGSWTEDANVTISYEATTGGSVSRESESLAPATGVAQGSTATAAAGYHFVNWTNAAGDEVSTSLTYVPDKVDGLNVAATYTANFAEDANVTISYEATTGGSVSRESESLAPATGVAQGSTATAAAGYHFVNWTNAAGDEVSTSLTYVPAKVDGLNVAATYTANFAKSTFAYTVNYILLDREGNQVGDTVTESNSGPFGDSIPYDETTRTHEGEQYVFLNVDREGATITEVVENNVLNVYFGIDTIGIDPVNPDAPDEIPDEKQIMFEYRAETGGTVSKAKEVITKDAEGKATPTGATAIPGDLYLFSKWVNGQREDINEVPAFFKEAYTSDQTFTAYFIEKVASLSVDKTSAANPISTVNDTISYTITVTNTGNIPLEKVVVRDELTGNTGDNAWTIDTLEPGRSREFKTSYTVTLDDVLAATATNNQLVNTAYAEAPNPLYVPVAALAEGEETTTTTQPEKLTASDSVQNTLAYRNLYIEKTVLNPQEVYDFGDVIQYKITVTNNGTYSEPAGLTIVDQLKNATGNVTGPGWNNGVYTLPPIAPNGFVEVYCSYTVPEADAGRVIFNKAAVISGTATQATDETDGEKIMPLYNLAIVYVDANTGYALAETYLAKLKAGTPFYVVSPVIEGYTTQVLAVKSDADGMPAHDLSIAVVYTPIAPEEEPEEDPKEPEVNVVTPTEDGGYDLTPISELDTPLADMDLGDHTCCIMHFLLMLASLITLAFYTDSRKKHQARIHQLRQSLKAEGKDDPSEKM